MKLYREAEQAWQSFLRPRKELTRAFDPQYRADQVLQVHSGKMLRALMSLMHMYFVLGYIVGARARKP